MRRSRYREEQIIGKEHQADLSAQGIPPAGAAFQDCR